MTDEMLMRHLDGELTPAEAREVERALAASAELRKKRDALLELRELVQARFGLAGEEVEPQLGPLWERVSAGLPAAEPVQRRPRVRLWTRVREWLETASSHVVTGGLAAAAGALIATVVSSHGGGAAAVLAAPMAAEVESLEVLGGSGMVFQSPSNNDKNDSPSTVIWITANEPEEDAAPDPGAGGPI
jgi:anti-sigma factor RsiW